jgi:aryl-alcohol dehydrogenase-like predicted oxidoreductase
VVLTTRRIADVQVSPIALGSASWPFLEGDPEELDALGIRAIRTALDEGITILDTAHVYTRAGREAYAEDLIARALREHPDRDSVFVATKGGHFRDGDAFPIDAQPDTVRRHCEASLRVLGVDRLDLYQLHWPDPEISMRDALRTFAELQHEGLIRLIGVSNVSVAQLEEARSVADVVSVQNHFGPHHQDGRDVLDHCTEHGIAYLAYSPLRGEVSLAGAFPRAAAVAGRKGISVQRLALAWLLQLSPVLIPISGASRPETVADSARAPAVELTDEDLAELDFAAGH